MFFLFLVLILPVRQLTDKVAELQHQENSWFLTTSQARLCDELAHFKTDLTAEAFVKNFVDSRIDKLDLAQACSELAAEDLPALRRLQLDLIYQKVAKALDIGGRVPQPLFLVVSDNRISEFRYHFAEVLARKSIDADETALFSAAMA